MPSRVLDFCGRPQYAVAIEEPVGEGVARLDGYWLDVDSRTRDVDPIVGDADALEALCGPLRISCPHTNYARKRSTRSC